MYSMDTKVLTKLSTCPRGEYIILIHQDVRLVFDGLKMLKESKIEEISKIDPSWAVLGNAGGNF